MKLLNFNFCFIFRNSFVCTTRETVSSAKTKHVNITSETLGDAFKLMRCKLACPEYSEVQTNRTIKHVLYS